METPLNSVEGYMVLNGIPAWEAKECKEEFVSFFLEAGETEPSLQADLFWHAFILHTELYREFCKAHCGKFIHHVPGSQ